MVMVGKLHPKTKKNEQYNIKTKIGRCDIRTSFQNFLIFYIKKNMLF